MADYRKVNRGDSPFKSPAFNANWQNDVTDMLNWFKRAKASGEVASGGSSLESSSGIVKVKNQVNTAADPEVDDPVAADLERGHYVQLGAYLLDDIDHRKHWFEGNLYDSEETGRIAILLKATKGALSDDESEVDGEIVRARTLGVCTAIVNVTSTSHRFAAPETGEYVLQSASSGEVEILSDVDSTGEQEVSVLLGGGGSGGGTSDIQFGVATSTIDPATGYTPDDWGEGTFKPVGWNGDLGGEQSIKNRFFETIAEDRPFWWITNPLTNEAVVLVPGCAGHAPE